MARKTLARIAALLAASLLFAAFVRPVQAQDIGRIVAAVRQMFAGSVSVVAPTDGQILTYVAATNTWGAGSGAPPIGAAGGDLTGTYPNPTLAKISALAAHSVTLSEGASALAGVAPVASGSALVSAGVAADPVMAALGVVLDQLGALPGDQLVRGTTTAGWGRVSAGTSTYVWTSNGPLTVPSWQAPAVVSLQGAYNGGAIIAEAGGSPVAISSTTADNGNVFTVTKNPAGAQSGFGLLITMGASTSGAGLAVSSSGTSPTTAVFSGGTITCPGLGSSSERFGAGAAAGGGDALALGNGALAGNASAIALGTASTTTAANQFVCGAATDTVTNVFFGSGAIGNAPVGFTVNGTASNTNGTAGASVAFAGGKANQAVDAGGSVSLQTAVTGAGTTLVDRVKPNAVAKTLTDAVATNLVQATVASNSVAGWHLGYTITVFDGTDLQVEHGIVAFTAINKAGTMSVDQSAIGVPSRKVTAGTLAVSFDVTTGAGTATCRVNADTSLVATTFTIVYTLENDSIGAVAIQ